MSATSLELVGVTVGVASLSGCCVSQGYDGPSLRLLPLGRDGDGFLYWFFYGTRLYREAPSRRTVRKKKTDDHSETGRGRGKATPSGELHYRVTLLF